MQVGVQHGPENVRNWKDVVWAMTTRVDPAKDSTRIDNTPINYPEVALPVSSLDSKPGFNRTNKWRGEIQRA